MYKYYTCHVFTCRFQRVMELEKFQTRRRTNRRFFWRHYNMRAQCREIFRPPENTRQQVDIKHAQLITNGGDQIN